MKLIFFELLVIYICGVYAKIHRLNKRQICSDLRTLGKCNSDCPCTQKGHCCSKYGFCGSGEKYCGEEKTKTRSSSKSSSTPGVIIYLPSYRLDSEIDIKTFDFSGIDVYNYCFYQITNDGYAYPGHAEMNEKAGMTTYVTTKLKEKYPHLKIILTIGGTLGSKNFKYFLRNYSTLKIAAKSITDVVKDKNFDGLDIDWEFPKSEEEASYLVTFIKKIREYMGYDKILTISASALTYRYYGHIPEMEPYLNWFNLMTYHYSGYWDKYSGYNAPLYAPKEDKNDQKDSNYTVESYLEEGVPPNKLVLGAPFMGQAWKVESSNNNGYNQVGDANIEGEPSNNNMEGFWSYNSLRSEGYLVDPKTPSSSWVRTWHSDVKSPTIYNRKKHIYISYDDVDSMCERAKYVKDKKIGGIMVWETGQDYKRELLDSLLDCYY